MSLGKRKVFACALVTGLVLGLGACSAGEPAPTASPGPVAAYSATRVAPVTVLAAATDKFKASQVQDAFEVASTVGTDTAFPEHLVRPAAYQVADFGVAEQVMTSRIRKSFQVLVARALAGDAKALGQVQAFTFVNATAPGVTFRADGPAVVNRVLDEVKAGVDTSDRLEFTMRASADLRMSRGGSNVLVPIKKSMTLWMTEVDGRWLVDGWDATFENLPPVADTT